jgi:hypothetical protein
VADTALLRRRPPAVRALVAPLAAHQPSRPHARYYPPRHLLTWALCWAGMLVILVVAVVSMPAVVDGTSYLAGAGTTVTFDPVSYQTNCDRYSCQTVTDGILETGGAGISTSWQNVVPLGRPFQVREPVGRWGLGLAMIDSDKTAIIAVAVSLLIDGFAVLVLVKLAKLARNWRRHRRHPSRSPDLGRRHAARRARQACSVACSMARGGGCSPGVGHDEPGAGVVG